MLTDSLVSSPPQDAVTPVESFESGWKTESHSVASQAAPEDTTLDSTSDHGETPPVDAAPTPPPQEPTSRDERPTPSVVPKKKPLASVQARIDKAVLAQRTAERRAEEAVARAQALEEKLQEHTPPPGRAGETTPKTVAPVPSPTPAPAVSGRGLPTPPQYVNFETDADYQAAVAAWNDEVEVAFATREAKLKAELAAESVARIRQTETEAKFAEMQAQHPDFHDLVEANHETFKAIDSFFVQDMVVNTPEGGELLYVLASNPDLALALGSLPLPSRPLADAVRSSPAALALMQHFATDAGREAFLALRTLPLDAVYREIGRLEARVDIADRGPVTRLHPITSAVPPAKPPVGSPRAREGQRVGAPAGRFDDWMKEEDAKERALRLRAAGVPIP